MVTLVVLLTNLVAGDDPVVAGAVGPVHGASYLVVIASALLSSPRARTRAIALVPGLGGVLVLRAIKGEPT